jgi:hypothetical protein
MKHLAPILAFGLAGSPASADFIETAWRVTGFTGEAWGTDTAALIGAVQEFSGGWASGPFFACDHTGLSMTYTAYMPDDFFANPEFALFAPLAEEIRAGTRRVFVHRISCPGAGGAAPRAIYPFVTTNARRHAYYLFEGGVFVLDAP